MPDMGDVPPLPGAPRALINPSTHPDTLPVPPSNGIGAAPRTRVFGDHSQAPAWPRSPARETPVGRPGSNKPRVGAAAGPRPVPAASRGPMSMCGRGGVGEASPREAGLTAALFPAPSLAPFLIGQLERTGDERPIRAKCPPLGAVPAAPIGESRGN